MQCALFLQRTCCCLIFISYSLQLTSSFCDILLNELLPCTKASCIPGAGMESALPYFNVILKFNDSKVRDIIWVTSENIDRMGCSFDPWGPQLIVAQADTKSLMILSHTVPPAVNSPNPHTTLQAEIFSNQNTKNTELQACIKT